MGVEQPGAGIGNRPRKVMLLCLLITCLGNRGSDMTWTVQGKWQPAQPLHRAEFHMSSRKCLRGGLTS